MIVNGQDVLTPLGLRSRHLVALTILRERGGLAQQTLAEALQIDRTNIVGLLNELEGDGLILRRRVAEDRRRHIVELTDDGAKKLAEADRAVAAAEGEVLAPLDAEQRETLYQLLQQAAAGQILDPHFATRFPN